MCEQPDEIVGIIRTPQDLENFRQVLGYSKRDLALVLGLPERTVQSYFYGERSIPASFIESLHELKRKDDQFFAGMNDRIDQALVAQFGPAGRFMSEKGDE